MSSLIHLLENNRVWSESVRSQMPDFFTKLSQQQAPEYLWIGCSDSRVPANEIVGLLPGELFVHRNVANVVVHSDLNCLSVIQFAVEVLQVKHIIVCGHYGCGGVKFALEDIEVGLADNWLRHVQDVQQKHARELAQIDDQNVKIDRLCELNAIEQALHVGETTIVQNAWKHGQELTVHSWVYGLKDGLAHDLNVRGSSYEEIFEQYQKSLGSR
ncbi:MAG: carbonate dehydratase [Verrucomicrobiales bacterium]|jgi:carbonic anhydrase|nr:carbonate dehydratase [Verrucomicrobiales bacterium]